MGKIIVDSIQANGGNPLSIEGDAIINGNISAQNFIDIDGGTNNSFLTVVTTAMGYAIAWQRSTSNFEFAFNTARWTTIGNPIEGAKPYSDDINPRTGNEYIVDYENTIRQIVAGCRMTWLDEDTSKYYDWNYTYVNPITLQDQPWEPKGMVLSNTAGVQVWNNTINYSVGNKVTYNGFIWRCNIANTNVTPITIFPATDYWQNTGVPVDSGLGSNLLVPSQYSVFDFDVSAYPGGQAYFYLYGSLDGGIRYWGYQLSNRLSPVIQGKMPVITLNTICNPNYAPPTIASKRYPTPFTVQYQMDMLDYVNTNLNLNSQKVDMINLGSNEYYRQGCDVYTYLCGSTTTSVLNYLDGYDYGRAMVEYVTQIRNNSEPITANAKIMMQGTNKQGLSIDTWSKWIYDPLNVSNKSKGFIHGFYNSQSGNTASTVDFDIISLQSALYNQEWGNLFYNAVNNSSVNSWAWFMGGSQYLHSRNTIDECKQALSLYSKQNRIKYWYRWLSRTLPPAAQGYTLNESNYSWDTQKGVFMSMILTATDPDFVGFQYNSLIDYTDCVVNLLYSSTDTFGPNTTDVMDLTSVGWMFKRFLNYFKPDFGALSYTRLLKIGGALGTYYGFTPLDYCLGIYINSTGINGTPKHRIILLNYSPSINQSLDIDCSQLIDPNWTNVQFTKIYTPQDAYKPINYYYLGNYITPQETAPYTPTAAQILSTQITPQEYLMITAY